MPAGALEAHGRRIDVEVMGRDPAPAPVDRPVLISGGWIRDGGVVVEDSFAAALRVSAGDRITIAGQPFEVAGIAVTAFRQPTPFYTHGLVWATRSWWVSRPGSPSSPAAAAAAGSDSSSPTPAAVGLFAPMPATLLLVALLTAIPSRAAGEQPVIDALRSD